MENDIYSHRCQAYDTVNLKFILPPVGNNQRSIETLVGFGLAAVAYGLFLWMLIVFGSPSKVSRNRFLTGFAFICAGPGLIVLEILMKNEWDQRSSIRCKYVAALSLFFVFIGTIFAFFSNVRIPTKRHPKLWNPIEMCISVALSVLSTYIFPRAFQSRWSFCFPDKDTDFPEFIVHIGILAVYIYAFLFLSRIFITSLLIFEFDIISPKGKLIGDFGNVWREKYEVPVAVFSLINGQVTVDIENMSVIVDQSNVVVVKEKSRDVLEKQIYYEHIELYLSLRLRVKRSLSFSDMLVKLIALLKKDAILATRSKVWTLFEMLLPVALLFLVNGFLTEFNKLVLKPLENLPKNFEMNEKSPMMYSAGSLCEAELNDIEIYLRHGDDMVFKEGKKGQTYFQNMTSERKLTIKEVEKELADCKKAILISHISGKDVTLYVPTSKESVSTKDWKTPFYSSGEPYMFAGIITQSILEQVNPNDTGKGYTTSIHVEKIQTRKVEMPEVTLPFFFAIIGASMAVTVINVVRTVVTEKATVKPYLSAIGLPGWLFYVEHFIATLLKSAITCMGAMKWFMSITYVSLPVMMLAAIIYIIGAIAFAILFSSLFTNAKRGIEASLIVWILAVCFPFSQEESSTSLLHSLNINYAYRFFLIKAQENSMADNKMTFGSLNDKTYVDGTSSGLYLLMMIVDAVWMFALALLIDRYGGNVSLITDLFKDKRAKAGGHSSRDVILEGCIENEKMRAKAVSDVELSNVVKIYPTGEKAVNGLSFRAIRGQVSILLGQNGCGKSTTFSMISGVALPTAGSIKVAGVDAVKQKEKARKFIGFCPQYNPLYERLTVLEHLELVNALKEGPPHKFMAEAKQLLQAIRLADKTGTQSANLSGGMKRKLCVCMAMIGGSKVVLLDEPTAGMDPGARKDVQLMLEKIKVNRTILLTTHYMDEAERLGDWVFVMSYGKMAASGSLNYLKKKFGSGLVLTVVLDVKSDRNHSTKLVEKVCHNFIPKSKLKDQRGLMIEVTLPDADKPKILPLLKTLEAVIDKQYRNKNISKLPGNLRDQIKRLKITTLGLSLSSLETVFIRICDECDIVIAKEKNLQDKRKKAEEHYELLMSMKKNQRVTGSSLQTTQFNALIQKRYYYTIRNIYQLFFQILVPIVIVCFGLYIVKDEEETIFKATEKVNLNEFPKSVVVLMKSNDATNYDEIKEELQKFKHLKIKEHEVSNHEKLVKKYYKEKLGFIVHVEMNRTSIYYNKMVVRGTSILLTLATNWFVSDEYNVEIKWITSQSEDAQTQMFVYLMIPFFVTLGFSLLTAPFVQFGIEERVCKFSHQQHLTGMSRMIFWSANIVWDAVTFWIYAGAAILIFLYCKKFSGEYHLVAMMFSFFMIAIIPMTYVVSLIFDSPTKASSLLTLYTVVISTIAVLAIMLMSFAKAKINNIITPVFYAICPPSAFLFGFFKAVVHKKIKENQMMQNFVEFDKLWDWKGITRDISFLCFASVVTTLIVYAMQNRSTRVAIFDLRHKAERPIPKKPVKLAPCRAVAEEEQLVRKNVKDCTVVVKNLVRTFGKFRAVNGLCVTVRHNECFGLLGTNGAGKTTTFDILTGLRFPSGGSAFIDGKDVVRHNYVGYCPQFDSILPDLKCIEALEIMAHLHGYSDAKKAVQHVLTCVGMVEHAHKHIRMCSGGQKRKISVGIAMLTRAKCVMMDEPTAGIDPRARREIWEILDWMREKSGSSIVLTSHSMEECEALCSRIAILRKGEMIALGTSQDLKSQYGNTYTMTMIVHKISDREKVCQEVQKRVPNSVLKTAMTNITTSLVWELPKGPKDKWSKKYQKVEKLAKKLKVKDFMLTQSSLEDTFINLTD